MSDCSTVDEGCWWKMYVGEYVWNFMLVISPTNRKVFTKVTTAKCRSKACERGWSKFTVLNRDMLKNSITWRDFLDKLHMDIAAWIETVISIDNFQFWWNSNGNSYYADNFRMIINEFIMVTKRVESVVNIRAKPSLVMSHYWG